MNCLDVGAPSTLSNIINLTGFGSNSLATGAAASPVVFRNTTNIFGQEIQCDGRVVGDGQVNVFDIAVVISYVFQDTPYAHLPTNPALVETVSGRENLDDLCDSGMTRVQYLTNYSADTCVYTNVEGVSSRRLSEGYSLSRCSRSVDPLDLAPAAVRRGRGRQGRPGGARRRRPPPRLLGVAAARSDARARGGPQRHGGLAAHPAPHDAPRGGGHLVHPARRIHPAAAPGGLHRPRVAGDDAPLQHAPGQPPDDPRAARSASPASASTPTASSSAPPSREACVPTSR